MDNKNNTKEKPLKNVTVLYQGLPCSYSESVSKALFPHARLVNKQSFEDVFKGVIKKEGMMGVVPAENSTSGHINEVYDLMLKYDLYINSVYIKKVNHCLAGTSDSNLRGIRRISSHPQALAQCGEYIKKMGFDTINEVNTAVAAYNVSIAGDKRLACICSPEAAASYGLKVLAKEINHVSNYTKFYVMAEDKPLKKEHNRINIVFEANNYSGGLNSVFSLLMTENINFTSIYSRPSADVPWRYLFYVELEGNLLQGNMIKVLGLLKKQLPFMKVLGSYTS